MLNEHMHSHQLKKINSVTLSTLTDEMTVDSLFYAQSTFKLRNSAVLYQIIGIIER